ncbi:MAG: hypothetical protein ACREOO_17430 [bacterium]
MTNLLFKRAQLANASLPLLLLSLPFVLSCNYDHGVDPVPTKISGEVIFANTPPPDYVREAVFIAAKKLPPDNLLTDVVFSDPLLFDTDTARTEPDTVRYELIVDAGKYVTSGVLWRRQNEPWDIANILGVYTAPGQITPQAIELTPEHPVADNVNIIANWDLAKRDAYIEGTVSFKDEWPANTEIVALAFYPVIPRNQFEYIIYLKGLDINVKKFTPTHHFRTAVSSGEYKFIALFWFGRGTSLADIRAAGFYHCPTDSLIPQKVLAPAGETTRDVNFDVYFSSLQDGGVKFCKDCGDCP